MPPVSSSRFALTLALPALSLLFAFASARAATQAEQFQANQNIHAPGEGNLDSYLYTLIHAQPRNIELGWPDTQPNSPPGTPPGANRVLITRFYHNGSYRLQCGDICYVTEQTTFISIYFTDGSLYFYQFSKREVVCTDGSSTTIESTLDTASTSQPNTVRIRSRLTNVSSSLTRGSTTTSIDREAFRSPPGGLILFPPGTSPPQTITGDLEIRTGPGGVLDLRGHSASQPLFVASGVVRLFADQILTDIGVTPASLFSPAPIIAAGENISEITLLPSRNLCPAIWPLLAARVVNLSNTDETINLGWFDDLGWVPSFGAGMVLPPGGMANVDVFIDVPFGSPVCDLDTLSISAIADGGATADAQIQSAILTIDTDGDGLCDWCESCPTTRAGDMSGNGSVGPEDIPDFTSALLGSIGRGSVDTCAADMNNDDRIDGADIASFVAALAP